VLIRAIKGGKAPTEMHAALMLKDASTLPNKQVEELLAGRGILPLAISRKASPAIAEASPSAALALK
jgi:tRNA1(Val) A37 N6-methylase TrmN6